MNQVIEGWLASASDDLFLISRILEDERLSHLAAFHAQQAIEKCLKAIMEYRGQPVPKVHSLTRLFELCCIQLEESESDLVNGLEGLYLDARYPGPYGLLPEGKPTISEVAVFHRFALSLFQRSKAILKQEGYRA